MLRMIVIWLVALPVLHWVVAVYSRSVRREKLEKEFDAGGIAGRREDFIRDGMARYEHGLRKKLIVLVYIVPLIVLAVTVYYIDVE